MEDAELRAQLSAHYEQGQERDRLSAGRGLLEFIRTTEIIMRFRPAAPALAADIGGGPGRYALWLAGLGYRVEHRDLMPLHVRQLSQDAGGLAGLRTAVGDARELDLTDAAADAVLLLGPLYHLHRRADRIRAPGPSFWTPPAPWSGCPSCWASARTCWPRESPRSRDTGPSVAYVAGAAAVSGSRGWARRKQPEARAGRWRPG